MLEIASSLVPEEFSYTVSSAVVFLVSEIVLFLSVYPQVEAGHIAFLQEMMARYKVCA